MIYWLKTKKDIDTSGYIYESSNCFPIDEGAIDLDLDNPARKFTVKKILGNGSSISGGDFYGDRVIGFSMVFKKDGVSTTGAFNAVRLAFLSKFIVSSDEVYLIRNYNGVLQYTRVYPVLGSEKYKNFMISNDFNVKLYCDVPFFHNVDQTVTSSFSKTNRFHDVTFNNPGVPTPIQFEGTLSAIDTEVKIGVFDNYGIRITHAFTAGDKLKVDSGDLRIWLNGVERFNLVYSGTPFNIQSGETSLRIESISAMTDCTISYRERHL